MFLLPAPKKFIIFLLVMILLPAISFPVFTRANIVSSFTDVRDSYVIPYGPQSIRALIVALTAGFLTLISVIAMAVIIYGGFLILTSVGNEEKTVRGKKAIVLAIAGLIVIGLSVMIVNAVFKAA